MHVHVYYRLAALAGNTAMFVMCIIFRMVSGAGSAIIGVIITGIVMKSKFFSNNQVYVSSLLVLFTQFSKHYNFS